ncbi:MAG: hypothetical protein Kow002_08540 [Anaerolineales bacterium]
MQEKSLPPFRPFLLPSLFMFILGAGGILALVRYTEPLVWARWGLYALLFIALTGLALPVVYFFHLRFPSSSPPSAHVIVRQAQWAGVYGILLLWLRSGELLTLWLGFGLAAGLMAIESLLRLRERSLWTPPLPSEPSQVTSDDQSA